MGNKNKKKLKALKRKLEQSNEESTVSQIVAQKRRMNSEDEKMHIDEEEIKNSNGDLNTTNEQTEEELELLPTRCALAQQLVIALNAKYLSIIEGSIGSGKTYLARFAAAKISLPIHIMQMGDQIDSKSLFGSYHCTEIAGQFKWKPSSFSKWLLEPCVILLEDLDLANADVISMIVQMVKTRSVILPSGGTLVLHDQLRIVATLSGNGKRNSVLDGVAVRITLQPMTDDELRRLVTKTYPRVAHLSKTLTKIFRSLEAVPASANSRQLTSADLLRGCFRVSRLADLSSNTNIFSELCDAWCLADPSDRAQLLCQKVAAPLSISSDQVSFHLSMRQPSHSHDDVSYTIGRAKLSRSPTLTIQKRHKLGHTRDVLQLMERIAVCVGANEPVLLVGETGVGKTSVVQTLASSLNVTLNVVNLSPSSDSDELISGYKPTTIASILEPFTKFYYELFTSHFDKTKNTKFLSHLEMCLSSGRYRDYLTVVEATANKALNNEDTKSDARWAEVVVRARRIRDGLEKGAVPFAITRGAVLQAAQEGHWLLVDEINLAPPECLDAIVHAISSDAHPDFRLFACMNPATDAGKRRLPAGVRTRFTEFYVSETCDPHQLALVVSAYLPSIKPITVTTLVNFYLQSKQQFPSSYSLRTLCRALLFAADNMFGSEDRSLFEAVSMAFLTNLNIDDKLRMRKQITQTFKVASDIPLTIPCNKDKQYIQVGGYWIEQGVNLPKEDAQYVITRTVHDNLREIARIVCSGRFPVLLEGETSAGKTSIVCHIARITGNSIVRINNHEHTDIQEYMGSYVADEGGRLVFREGALVKAVKDGSWVILDELNLAPTDVIEALNRLLDDNRELFVPELNQAIRAHPRFRLFATQNPAGTYAGRKKLSRALLSRFVLLRFHHLPMDELSSMVCTRCGVHPSAAEKMIAVLSDLRQKRSLSGLFSARDGLMTLRDVFRWAKRLATDETCDDWLQILANHGYFLLAGRCRNRKDEDTVVETLERVLKRNIKLDALFAVDSPYMPKIQNQKNLVLTRGMRRMLVMTQQAWLRNEAVLMVGETGGGKTSLAEALGGGRLMTINCHERTETADLLGRLRPKTGGGFEWSDGIVIAAMRQGAPLLVDEVSLAEDSVLERLNPLFEEDRCLLLSDAGVDVHSVRAKDGFQIIATMNPGGDYGKKELSKALRNRFTEVWSSCDYDAQELLEIFDSRIRGSTVITDEKTPTQAAKQIIRWIGMFFEKYMHVFRHVASVRDVVACADLYSAARSSDLPHSSAVREAVAAVFLDSLASLPTRVAVDVQQILADSEAMLSSLLSDSSRSSSDRRVVQQSDVLSIGLISVPFGPLSPSQPKGFSLEAPTCVANFYRIARGLLINKPILLEGAPGCGKSSTVMALAQLTGNPITRLNLSDQTDLSDLFGSDVPVITDDGSISFEWQDGPVLKAIKQGHWVLLDEMNLASQSVLEGLNSCFDHRRVLYIAELNKSFEIPSTSCCRFFACQNPRAQGGNRRALPKSFVNRFTNIYVDDLTEEDVLFILREANSIGEKRIDESIMKSMVAVNGKLSCDEHLTGGPFSFNLRDLLRWMQLYKKTGCVSSSYDLLFVSRMRTEVDRQKLRDLFEEHFGSKCVTPAVILTADENELRIGQASLPRSIGVIGNKDHRLLSSQLSVLHQLATCVENRWLPLLIGPRNGGKCCVLENLAACCGVRLYSISLNADTDAQELIGSYEQIVDENAIRRASNTIIRLLKSLVDEEYLNKIGQSSDTLELETAAEMAFSQVKGNKNVVAACREELETAAKTDMRFEWIDSLFVKAFVEGHWILINDVNLCSAAVLDRLNSCLENDGRLVISERQSSFESMEPHPNFRVFFAMDSCNGEVSRAMRNRSVELYMAERQQWNTSPDDIIAVAASIAPNTIVPYQVAECLASLSSQKQLHFCVLLNEMNVEDACRAVGVEYPDELEEEHRQLAITINEVGTDRQSSWMLNSWLQSSDESISHLFLCLLSCSPKMVQSDELRKHSNNANSFVSRLLPLVSFASPYHPIDDRFSNGSSHSKACQNVVKYVLSVVMEWTRLSIESIPIEDQSAEHLCRTLTKYQLSTNQFYFKNMEMIGDVITAVLRTLKDGSMQAGEVEIFSICISLIMLSGATRRTLTHRAGCASIYLAWSEVQQFNSVAIPGVLSRLMNQLNNGWSAENHERFVKQYLKLHEEYRLAEPFTTQDACIRFSATTDTIVEDVDMSNDEDEKRSARVSPIDGALKLVGNMHQLSNFLATLTVDETNPVFDSQRPLITLEWRDDTSARFVRTLSLLNSLYYDDDRVLTIPHFGSFSMVIVSFWDSLTFDSSMNLLTVSDLRRFALSSFVRQLWRLAPNSINLSNNIRSELDTVAKGIDGWNSEANPTAIITWKTRMESGMTMMNKAVPPADTLDPVIYEEEKTTHMEAKLQLVTNQLNILAEWRNKTGRFSSDCDLISAHPVVSTLVHQKDSLECELSGRRRGESVVYRQSANQYSAMCSEMRSFASVTVEVVENLRTMNPSELTSQELQLLLARLHSYVMSANSFRQSTMNKYSSFIDVLMSFLTAVDMIITAVHEAALILESVERRRELHTASAFPHMFKLSRSEFGVKSDELLAWSVRDGSPMPLRLKAAVVRRRILERIDPMCDLEWTRKQWQKWYEKNIAKAAQKDFVYKTKTEEEKDELDVIEFFNKEEQDKEVLPAVDVSLLLDAAETAVSLSDKRGIGNAVSAFDRESADAQYSMALIWLRHLMMGLDEYQPEFHSASIDSDLRLLSWVSAQEDSQQDGPLDVYRAASIAEFRKAADLLESLASRINEIQERWPEVVSLKLVLESIELFKAAPLSTPQVKMSTLIENVIEQSEEWEKMADRANSAREQLAPIRELLVNWKKMEVRSWSQLLTRAMADARLNAQLVALPLFDALFKAQTEETRASVIPMAAEWLSNATLLDFTARLRSIQSLAEWAELLSYNSLAEKLRSVVAHFQQYAAEVEKKLVDARVPTENSLKDYLAIVKYNDLNLWNIKVASQRAHSHLFKIIRKFKAAVCVEVSTIFDGLMSIEEWKNIDEIVIEMTKIEKEEGKVKRARQLAQHVLTQGSDMCNVDAVRELNLQSGQCDSNLKTMIVYIGEDEEKEKQQGYARNSRQREVAMVIKEAQAEGINARRAITLKQEDVTESSLTGVAIGGGREHLVRICSGGRNACIRKSNKANDQLGIATRKHLSGVVEYGMWWMVRTQGKVTNWEKSSKRISDASIAIQRIKANMEVEWYVDHETLSLKTERMQKDANDLVQLISSMKKRLEMAPESSDDLDSTSTTYMHPLSLLYQSHDQMSNLKGLVGGIHGLAEAVRRTTHQMIKESKSKVFQKGTMIDLMDKIKCDTRELSSQLDGLQEWFEEDTAAATTLVASIIKTAEIDSCEIVEKPIETDKILICIQELYKAIVEKTDWKEKKTMDRLDDAISAMETSDIEKIVIFVENLVSECRVGILPSNITDLCSLIRIVSQLLHRMIALISSALQAVCILYHTILSMAMQLFEKGYVNTIPKPDKQESGDGERDETGEGGGMGEGKSSGDAKDVTDEMEETGQIEGLEGDEEEPPTGDSGSNEKPIEMDEDFAEDIQDIDRNEKGNDEEGDDSDDEEPEAEDQMGDVDEEDDKQLDPKLWDEEEEEEKKDEPKNTDQENQAADNKTNELAAKEDDTVSAEEKKDEEKEAEQNEENENDLENMDDRDREDEENDDQQQMNEDARPDEIDQPDDEKGEDMDVDQALDKDENENDDEEETKEGEGEDDVEDEEAKEADENEPRNVGEDEEKNTEEEDKAESMEQGTGGEKRDADKNEEEGGGQNEDEEEKEEDEKEEKGEGQSKSDDRGEAGKGTETKEKEDAEKEEEKEDEERMEEEEGAEKKRELATESENVEDAEEGEGEENEAGKQMESSANAERQMREGGSIEEAQRSKKEERKEEMKRKKKPLIGQEEEMDVAGEDEGEQVAQQASIHLAPEDMFSLAEDITKDLVLGDHEDKMERLGKEAETKETSVEEAARMWTEMSRTVAILSAELAENLRLVLEPQRATKMQGDYRTGKRLNMRRLIPYIASEYRKDRIWMRRTKRAQRDYQVMIAVDDSASMNENAIHQVTCESVCVIEDALRTCDAGAVSVVSFGKEIKTIAAFGQQMTPGPELLQKLTFDQSTTDFLSLLKHARQRLADVRSPTSEQLLIIISDGRLGQEAEKVKVALAALQGVTVLFVILDSGPQSIEKLTKASFQGDKLVLIPYLSLFPFPFYAVVKSITQLPSVLSESIRQWFEMTVQTI